MKRYIFMLACALIAVTYVSISVFNVSFHNLWRNDTLQDYIGEHVWLTGRVVSPPQVVGAGFNMTIVLEAESIETPNALIPVRGRISVLTPVTDVNFGDTIIGFTELTHPAGPRFEGGFDQAMRLRQQDIYVSGHFRRFDIVEYATADFSLTGMGVAVRGSIIRAIDENFSGIFGRFYPDNEVAGVVTSIMVGDRSNVSDQIQRDFSRAGIGQILAVSGMHVGILFTILSFLLIKFRVRKVLAHLVAILVLLLFMSVALYTPSVTRATIMMVIFLLAYIFQKEPDQQTSLGLAAIVILVLNPYSVMSASFWLSFSAVAGILVFYQPFNESLQNLSHRISRKSRVKIHKYFPESLALSAATWLSTVFLFAGFFNMITFAGFLTNLIAMPIVAFILVGGFAVWAVSWIPILPTIVAHIVAIPVVFLIEISNLIAGFRFLWFHVPTPGATVFVAYVILLIGVYIWTRRREVFSQLR